MQTYLHYTVVRCAAQAFPRSFNLLIDQKDMTSSSFVESDVKSNIKEYHVGNNVKFHPTEEEFVKLAVERPSAKMRKTEEAFVKNEIKKMMLADSQSESVRLTLAADRPPEEPVRAQPKLECGQSVHFWWASWMNGCKEGEAPLQISKKARPKWYHAQIHSPGTWMSDSYGGVQYEGWYYKAY